MTGRPRLRRTLDVVVLLAVLVLIGQLTRTSDERTAPFVQTAERRGEWMTGRDWKIKVRRVREVKRIAPNDDFSEPALTSGRWIVLDVDLRARRATTSSPTVGVQDADGTTWWHTGRRLPTPQISLGETLAPGIGARGAYVIEVPRSAKPVRIRVLALPSTQLDSELRMPIGTIERSEEVVLAEPKVVT